MKRSRGVCNFLFGSIIAQLGSSFPRKFSALEIVSSWLTSKVKRRTFSRLPFKLTQSSKCSRRSSGRRTRTSSSREWRSGASQWPRRDRCRRDACNEFSRRRKRRSEAFVLSSKQRIAATGCYTTGNRSPEVNHSSSVNSLPSATPKVGRSVWTPGPSPSRSFRRRRACIVDDRLPSKRSFPATGRSCDRPASKQKLPGDQSLYCRQHGP